MLWYCQNKTTYELQLTAPQVVTSRLKPPDETPEVTVLLDFTTKDAAGVLVTLHPYSEPSNLFSQSLFSSTPHS